MNDLNQNIENNNIVIDINEEEFATKVVEESAKKIIIVDFWAPWCEPCKQLTPLLEEIVKESSDLLTLAKINIDDNKQLATQLQIQSIPTVVAFHNKQIVNGFQGALPRSKIVEFIEKIIGKPLKKNNNVFYENVNELFIQNNWTEAKNLIEDFLSENSNDAKTVALYIKCLTNLNEFEDTKNFIGSLSDELIADQNIKNEISNFKLFENMSSQETEEALINKFNSDPKNVENLLALSKKYFYEKETEKGLELLLKNFSRFNSKDKSKIKNILLDYFKLLGDNHEQTKLYRKQLSSLIFS